MTRQTLKSLINADRILLAPGVSDTLGAVIAERAGFPAVFLSGSAMACASLGRPDIGLMSLEEVANTCRRIAERSCIPVVVDADSGFGSAFHVYRAVRALELSGAAGIQIEDQVHDQHPADIGSRPVIPIADMVDKIKAALDARRSEQTVISARTDAVISVGVDAAIDRAHEFIDAGADMVFVEALPDKAARARLVGEVNAAVPLLYNLAWSGSNDAPGVAELADERFSVALAPGVAITASAQAIERAFAELVAELPNGAGRVTVPAAAESAADAINAEKFLARYSCWSKR